MRSRTGKGLDWVRAVLWHPLTDRSKGSRVAAVMSASLLDHPVLKTLPDHRLRFWSRVTRGKPDIVLGWGRKGSGRRAVGLARARGCGLMLVEDGFLRSAGREDAPISMVVDDEGIYYDANRPSRLERLIATQISEEERGRARRIRQAWVASGVSKYNSAREYQGPLPGDYVLVLDQVAGDASIRHGRAGPESFLQMLEAALQENPDSIVVVKTHPDRGTRGARGHFSPSDLEKNDRILVISEPCHPVRLIRGARAVYTVTSQVGFEALMHGVPVRCFGMPFYAGWGLTLDEIVPPARRGDADLDRLVHAALIGYPRYVDPQTGEISGPEEALAYLGMVRRLVADMPEVIHAVGFSLWKRPILRRMRPFSRVIFAQPEDVPEGADVAVWGAREISDLPASARIHRVEDGFLRSVGLGADLTQPMSWIMDGTGIYFDPRRPSRLERILQEEVIPRALCDRAAKLRRGIVEKGISKYNIAGGTRWRRPEGSKRVILVPGQVEDDASIRTGAPGPRTNAYLLARVRLEEPEAWIVYKPHPDVRAGLRIADGDPARIAEIADEIVTDVPMPELLVGVDKVHTMTSLAGFEALLRGVSVVCHGIPFYAGWGLTEDRIAAPRRGRRRRLDELVAAALILYPIYTDPASGTVMTPESVMERLSRDVRLTSAGRGLRPMRRVMRAMARLSRTTGRSVRRR